MRFDKRLTAGVMAAALFAGSLGACVDLSAPETNPNTVGDATLPQFLVTAQVNSYFYNESEVPRLAMIWTEQLLGNDRQFTSLEVFDYSETDGGDNWGNLYRQGGLIDVRRGIELAEEEANSVAAGILKIHEAFLVGMAASWWGDIPYSEAVNPEITEPALDPQLEVYAAVQSLLDEAISDLQSGSGFVGGADLNYGGDAAKWIAAAHTLKARFYMHLAQLEGQSAYQAALSNAQQGIMDPANNWTAVHTTSATENNLWYMFQRDRSGYIIPDPDMIALLEARNDPRRDVYFNADGDEIAVPATQGYDQPIVSCTENMGIIAEAQFQLGSPGLAADALESMVNDCQAGWWELATGADIGLTYTAPATLTLAEIMTEKYIGQFMNPEIWTDYRRTCLPDVPLPTGALGGFVPERLYYPDSERQTNPNIPQEPPPLYEDLQLPTFPDYPANCS